MIRILTILIFILAGLPRVGIDMIEASFGHDCSEMVCQHTEIEPPMSECCDEPAPVLAVIDEYCSMSGGDCRCGVSPDNDHAPGPKAPLQRSDTQLTLGLSATGSVEVPSWAVASDYGLAGIAGLIDGLASLRTHNQTQALLGIWRT